MKRDMGFQWQRTTTYDRNAHRSAVARRTPDKAERLSHACLRVLQGATALVVCILAAWSTVPLSHAVAAIIYWIR